MGEIYKTCNIKKKPVSRYRVLLVCIICQYLKFFQGDKVDEFCCMSAKNKQESNNYNTNTEGLFKMQTEILKEKI